MADEFGQLGDVQEAINGILAFLRELRDRPLPQAGSGTPLGQPERADAPSGPLDPEQDNLERLARRMGAFPVMDVPEPPDLPSAPDPLAKEDDLEAVEPEPPRPQAKPRPTDEPQEIQEPRPEPEAPESPQPDLSANLTEIRSLVDSLIERDRQLAGLDLPDDVDESGEAEGVSVQAPPGLSSRVAQLEVLVHRVAVPKPMLLPDMGDALAWGYPTANWSAGNSITLDPCNEDGDDIPGATNVTAYIVSPYDKAITYAELLTTNIIGYLPYGENLGLIVTVIHGGTYTSPKTMLPAGFETAAAQTDTWDRASQGANDGVSVRYQTRMSYAHGDADPQLYAYYRTLTFDSAGMLKSMSAETRITVDDTEPCS